MSDKKVQPTQSAQLNVWKSIDSWHWCLIVSEQYRYSVFYIRSAGSERTMKAAIEVARKYAKRFGIAVRGKVEKKSVYIW